MDVLSTLSGEDRSLRASCLRTALAGFALPYRTAVAARNRLYDGGWFSAFDPGVPVISVGNLTAGGTGKTPVTAHLAKVLLARGARPCLLSRGYKSQGAEGNDEKRVLDRICPGVPHLQHPDRCASARRAISEHQASVLLLDDGFQHRRLARTLDLVLIDVTNPWGFGRVLPRGLLREPKSSLRRADAVLLTRCDHRGAAERRAIAGEVHRVNPLLPVIEVSFPIRGVVDAAGERASLANWSGRPIATLCGIGQPRAFAESLATRGFPVVSALVRPDHHHYQEVELQAFGEDARRSGAAAILTTLKDLVKIPHRTLGGLPLLAVEIEAEVTTGEHLLAGLLDRIVPPRRELRAA